MSVRQGVGTINNQNLSALAPKLADSLAETTQIGQQLLLLQDQREVGLARVNADPGTVVAWNELGGSGGDHRRGEE
jgi:hypothetical protein